MADFNQDWSQLSKDIILPPFFDKADYFSSVLRVSSAELQLWTHYDVSLCSICTQTVKDLQKKIHIVGNFGRRLLW